MICEKGELFNGHSDRLCRVVPPYDIKRSMKKKCHSKQKLVPNEVKNLQKALYAYQ